MRPSRDTSPVWFITGCSTGLGRALAERVLQRGHRCAVTARDPAQIEGIVAAHPKTSLAIALDVTQQAQLEQAAARAEAVFGGIDVLVNNAGYGYLAAVEGLTQAPASRRAIPFARPTRSSRSPNRRTRRCTCCSAGTASNASARGSMTCNGRSTNGKRSRCRPISLRRKGARCRCQNRRHHETRRPLCARSHPVEPVSPP